MARRPRPKLVKLKPPAGDTAMADTLLYLLGHIRTGRVKAFSLSVVYEKPNGLESVVEGSTGGEDDACEMMLLGAMRMAEHGLVERRRKRKASE